MEKIFNWKVNIRCFFGFHQVVFECVDEDYEYMRCKGMCTLCGTPFLEIEKLNSL